MADENGEVPAVVPAAPAVVPEQGRLNMPEFAGNDGNTDSVVSMQAEAFLDKYNNWAGACAYTDQRKAQAFTNALTKDAKAWLLKTTRKKVIDVNNWTALTDAFKARFIRRLAPHYIATEMSKLAQRPNEAVATFFDRCELAQTLLDSDWNTPQVPNNLDAAAIATYNTAWNTACRTISDKLTLHHFLRNLRPDISARLASCTNLTTVQEHVDAAEKIHASLRETRKAANHMAAIETAEVSATNAKPQRRTQKKSSPPPPGYVCRLCQIKGHWIYECKLSDKVKNGANQSRGPPRTQAPRHLGTTPQPTNQWQPKSFPINKTAAIDAQQQQQAYNQYVQAQAAQAQATEEYGEQQMASLYAQPLPADPQNWPAVTRAQNFQ